MFLPIRGHGTPTHAVRLKAQDRKELKQMLSGGIQQVRVVLRALALLQLDAGLSSPKVSRAIPFAAQSIRTIAKRYAQGGLERTLFERKRTGHAELLEASDKQRIIAMVCSPPLGASALDGAPGLPRRRSSENWFLGGPGNDPHFATKPRLEAVAGKNVVRGRTG